MASNLWQNFLFVLDVALLCKLMITSGKFAPTFYMLSTRVLQKALVSINFAIKAAQRWTWMTEVSSQEANCHRNWYGTAHP